MIVRAVLVGLLLAVMAAPAAAPVWAATGGPVLEKPVYSPEAKSYFELMKSHIRWPDARVLARQREYKGARGRLAIVRSREVHDLIREKLRPDSMTWIGLRYFCGVHKLMWVDGSVHKRSQFSPWHRVWNYEGTWGADRRVSCTGKDTSVYFPVHYWSANKFYWNANGTLKAAEYYVVEYPTGKE